MHPEAVSTLKKPIRPPERKHVTIAIGMIADNGIVVAADTQETTPQWMKTSQSKILVAHLGTQQGPKRLCLISGAGQAGYLDAAYLRMAETFLANRNLSLIETEKKLSESLEEFYKRHVIPFAQFSSPPELALILAAQKQLGDMFEKKLWITDNNLIRQAMPFVTTGIGSTYARILLDRLWMRCDVDTAKIIAAYVIYQVKECIDGCGKWTQIISSRDGVPERGWSYDVIEDMERLFRKYLWAEGNAFHYLAAKPSDAKEGIKPFSSFLKKMRGDLRKIIDKAEKSNAVAK